MTGDTHQALILEITRALIDGDQEAVLHTLANELKAALPGLVPEDRSKAQRVYRLRAA